MLAGVLAATFVYPLCVESATGFYAKPGCGQEYVIESTMVTAEKTAALLKEPTKLGRGASKGHAE